MRIATNRKPTKKSLHIVDELAKANEFNYFLQEV